MSHSKSESSFGQTLQFITSIKLQELEKQRLAYRAHAQVLKEANAIGDDLVAKVEVLLKAVRSWSGSGEISTSLMVGGDLNLFNLDHWLKQAKKDPSFNKEIVKGWAEKLESHIRHTMMRFDCAKLFGNLFNEWLASGDSSAVAYQGPADDGATDASFEMVDAGRKEMYEQKERLTSIIFDEKPIDTEAFVEYLKDLFEEEEAAKALVTLREDLERFGARLLKDKLRKNEVIQTIHGILATGLMDEEKRSTLKEFLDNPTVLEEVASVLNMRLASLDTWKWPAEGVLVEMRRHLNGKYRHVLHILNQNSSLMSFSFVIIQGFYRSRNSRFIDASLPWREVAGEAQERIQSHLPYAQGTAVTRRWLPFHRGDTNTMRLKYFLLSQLSDSPGHVNTYDDLLDAPETDDDEGENGSSSPAMIKQKLLHIMSTECHLNKALHGTHAVVRSDLEWFGPSIPHAAILAIMGFFGVSSKWLTFFEEFLRAPLRFSGEAETRIRSRGTPTAYALSVVFGEALLFGMDFAVNQKADGLFLYRMHDDLWIWDKDSDKCAMGWKTMTEYAGLVGLTFNAKKTGSACVGYDTHKGLPDGDIRWGFLKFDAEQARFVIDQTDVDHHIVELRRQLASTKSVFGWINAYNKYMAFFLRNFGGRPALCFGPAHIDDIIDTFARIQRELFPGTQNGAVGHLRSVVEKRFGMKDLPDGYFYFPISSGGLELRNAMVEIFALPAVTGEKQSDWNKFLVQMKKDVEAFKDLKEAWEISPELRPITPARLYRYQGEFMSFEEFISLRESWLRTWGDQYERMLEVPEPVEMALTHSMSAAMEAAKDDWDCLNWYNQWILALYGDEVVKEFGGLKVVDPTLIPVGMVQLFKSSRMKLDQ